MAASSVTRSTPGGFGCSEGCLSPLNNPSSGGGGDGGRHFNETMYEIDLEAEGNGGVATEGGVSVADSVSSSPSRSKMVGRNMFAKSPGSTTRSRNGSSRGGAPSSPSDMSTSTDRFHSTSGNSSVLTMAAAVAEVKVGVQSPAGRAALAFANACDGDDESVVSGSGGSGDGPRTMPPLPTKVEASPRVAAVAVNGNKSTTKPESVQDEGIASGASPRGARNARFRGSPLSPFACLSPQISPRAGSRLPEIDDEDMDMGVEEKMDGTRFSRKSPQISPRAGSRLPVIDDEDMDVVMEDVKGVGKGGPEISSPSRHSPSYPRGCDGSKSAGQRATSVVPAMSLERVIAKAHSRTLTPDLTPIAELAEKEFFSDSETESEISSRASSVSSVRSARRVPRDPAALLAAAMEKAGQIASIPAPSAGSPGQIGRPLSAVQEVPMEAIPLHGLINSPERTGYSSPSQGGEGRGFHRDKGSTTTPTPPETQIKLPALIVQDTTEEEAPTPIPAPAQRPPRHESVKEGALPLANSDNSAGNRGVRAPSPARSKQEEQDEEQEHKAWEVAMEKEKKAMVAVDRDAPTLDNPSATPVGVSMQSSSAVPPDETTGAQSTPVETEQSKPPGFSLKVALASFLGRQGNAPAAPVVSNREEADLLVRQGNELAEPVDPEGEEEADPADQDTELAAPVVPEADGEEDGADPADQDTELSAPVVPEPGGEEDEADPADQDTEFAAPVVPEQDGEEDEADPTAVSIDFPDEPVSLDCSKSLESYNVDGLPDAIAEKRPKTSLDDGFMDVSIPEVSPAMEEQGADADGGAAFKLPARVSPVELPAIVLPADKTGEVLLRCKCTPQVCRMVLATSGNRCAGS